MANDTASNYLSIVKAAKKLRVPKARIYRAIKIGRIKFRRATGDLARYLTYVVDPATYEPPRKWKRSA